MKKFIAIVAAAVIVLLLASPVLAADVPSIVSISVSPTSLDFGEVEAGRSSSAEQLTVTNNGTVAISVTADTVNDEGDFYRASLTLDSYGLDSG